MYSIPKAKRWPYIIILILCTTIFVNIFFAWLAISDHGGGFEIVTTEMDDSSYKRKMPLEESY
jgi:hypothetical protein